MPRRTWLQPRLAMPITLLLVAWCAFGVGCSSGGSGPQIGQVEGTITLDGVPLPDAGVSFVCEGARPSIGRTDAQGHYQLTYARGMQGAVVGNHRVTIVRVGEEGAPQPQPLPACYNKTSTLSADVKAGHNTFDFPLSSTPPR